MFKPLQDSDYPDQTFGGAEKVQKSDHWKVANAWGGFSMINISRILKKAIWIESSSGRWVSMKMV